MVCEVGKGVHSKPEGGQSRGKTSEGREGSIPPRILTAGIALHALITSCTQEEALEGKVRPSEAQSQGPAPSGLPALRVPKEAQGLKAAGQPSRPASPVYIKPGLPTLCSWTRSQKQGFASQFSVAESAFHRH